jgi:hypothetical protein
MGTFYEMFVTAANAAGSYGVQVWIHRDVKFKQFCTVRKSPRLMVVVGTAYDSETVFARVSAHAPTLGAEDDIKWSFWNDLTSVMDWIDRRYAECFLLLLVDATARVGSLTSELVGNSQPGRENANGTFLHNFARMHQVSLVNTHFQAGYTWTSQHGTVARIDYVGCKLGHFRNVMACVADDHIDLSMGSQEDHRMVRASFKEVMVTKDAKGKKRNQRLNINKTNLNDRWRREQFQQTLWQYAKNSNPTKN